MMHYVKLPDHPDLMEDHPLEGLKPPDSPSPSSAKTPVRSCRFDLSIGLSDGTYMRVFIPNLDAPSPKLSTNELSLQSLLDSSSAPLQASISKSHLEAVLRSVEFLWQTLQASLTLTTLENS